MVLPQTHLFEERRDSGMTKTRVLSADPEFFINNSKILYTKLFLIINGDKLYYFLIKKEIYIKKINNF